MMRWLLLALALLAPTTAHARGPLEFRLSFSPKLRKEAFTGRAYVVLTKADRKQLMRMVNWFRPEPFFAKDFTGVKPGQAMVIDGSALAFPTPLAKLPRGTYTVQAVIDLAPGDMSFATAPGNLYTITRLELGPDSGPVELNLGRVYEAAELKETARIKPVKVQSRLLTAFHGKAVWMRAAVILPASYEKNVDRKYPVYFEIPGFSGNHLMAPRYLDANSTMRGGVEVIHVLLDPGCHHGHHVFADSANNGPWGRALVEELVPIIDARFRTAGARGRLVGGHSSGGWSSLWLQITYPDAFNGCWSTSPDPVDFRDFQRLNIYDASANFYLLDGKPRPVARSGKAPFLYNRPFVEMETVMGHGGQLASFEGCFSERGPDGQPKRLWDRKTGKLDPAVAKSWEKYDIRLVLSRRWKELGPKLQGKLRVYMGDLDTFYLEGATRLLKEELKKLGSDAKVELFPGLTHNLSPAVRKRVNEEMAARLKALKVVE